MIRPVGMFTAAMLCASAMAAAQTPSRPAEGPRSVTLSLAEFNRLSDAARRPPAATPPVAAVLERADLHVRVEGAVARGQFALAGEVLRPGLNRVTLISGGTVLDATSNGRPLPLVLDGQSYDALIQGPAPFAAALEWGAPLTVKPGRASFVLPVPPAGAARATIDVPGEIADVSVSAGAVTRRTAANGRTVVEVALDPGKATDVAWSVRDTVAVAAAREARIVADVMTLITLGDADLRLASLVDVVVLQGEPRSARLLLPSGYQVTGVTGSSVEMSEPAGGAVTVTFTEPAARHHAFVIALERAHADGSFAADTGFVTVVDAQRERGDVAVEGVGTLNLEATPGEGLHRIDVREIDPALQSLARAPLLSAFRYQTDAHVSPRLVLAATRFGDASVLAASVETAHATTLMTSEGRALTEVRLRVENRAQPFLKVILPPSASIVSVMVAGEPAKPVSGDDGTRVPLLRAGFRPSGPYDMSFVYLHARAPFSRKGDLALTLPRMDIPVGLVEWELFAPDTYSMRFVDGNAITDRALDRAVDRSWSLANGSASTKARQARQPDEPSASAENPMQFVRVPGEPRGRVSGVVRDASGAVLPGVTLSITAGSVRRDVVSDGSGHFLFANVPNGQARLIAFLAGFNTVVGTFVAGNEGQMVDVVLRVGAIEETVTVSAASPPVDVASTARSVSVAPSEAVINLQKQVAGVLPIPIDVPRAGTSLHFSRALVIDDETRVTFRYSRK